jgi:nitrogen fixation protein FixH
MTDLLLGLGIGVALIVLANLSLIRFAHVSAKWAAAVTALTTVGLYVPYAILSWPGGDVFAIHLAIYLLTALACGMLLGIRSSGQGLHWGPATLIGFFIFVAVSGAVFIAVAEHGVPSWVRNWLLPEPASQRETVSMFPGVIAHDFHKKEALYNQYLQQVERQRQRGWQVRKGWVGEPVFGEPALFRVAVQTREGEPLTGATVAGQFLRTSTSQLDVDVALGETAPGVYESKVALPAAGRWNLVLSIRQGDDLHEVQASTEIPESRLTR